MNDYNKMITKFLKNPGKMYINMTSDELSEFFSKGGARLSKEKCKSAYTLTNFRRGILQANHLVRLDEDRHTVDLMMFALGQIEDLTQTVRDLQEIIKDYENQLSNKAEDEEKTVKEESQEFTETEDKKIAEENQEIIQTENKKENTKSKK